MLGAYFKHMSPQEDQAATPVEPDGPVAGDRRHSEGSIYTNVRRRRDEHATSRWQTVGKAVAHGVAAAILLAAGTVWTLNQQHPQYVQPGS